MIGYKVLSKDGLKGPFKKSSIIKAITSAMIPLQARLLDLSTGMYIRAADLVGEEVEEQRPQFLELVGAPKDPEPVQEPGEPPAEKPRVILSGKVPLKRVRLPNPRKLSERSGELELNYPAA